MKQVTLLTGGGRSGKSGYALALAARHKRKVFIATAMPFDGEMRERIAKHQEDRGSEWTTIEEPHDLASAIRTVPEGTDVVVIDCLTVWLGNLMHRDGPEVEAFAEVAALIEVLKDPPCEIILVTNELGMGIIPENAMVRRFRDIAGRLNQQIAGVAHRVVLVVCGQPLTIKGKEE